MKRIIGSGLIDGDVGGGGEPSGGVLVDQAQNNGLGEVKFLFPVDIADAILCDPSIFEVSVDGSVWVAGVSIIDFTGSFLTVGFEVAANYTQWRVNSGDPNLDFVNLDTITYPQSGSVLPLALTVSDVVVDGAGALNARWVIDPPIVNTAGVVVLADYAGFEIDGMSPNNITLDFGDVIFADYPNPIDAGVSTWAVTAPVPIPANTSDVGVVATNPGGTTTPL